ncbi:MAG TPA: phosphatidate cytidylyltransferase [Candidatus Faecivicinus avistercoris]|nr:phosphatidate cytidylyltransferase [Candidatus Faecivicinus avistercoris]
MVKRVITGAVFTVVLLLGVALQGWVLRGLLLFAMLVSLSEMYRAFRRTGADPVRWAGYLYCVLAVLAQSLYSALDHPMFGEISPPMLALTLSLLIAMTVIVARGKVAFVSMVTTVFPMLYPGLFFSLMITLQDLSTRFASTVALLLAFFIASVNDVFALLVGVQFGRHKLSPEISPKKSVEGSIGGLAASVLFAVLVPVLANWAASIWPEINPTGVALPPLWAFALLGLIAGALSQVGDLVASLVKRHCGIKDFGTIFPGHGGMMDRMDGILFCGVACYLFFRLAGL